MMDSEKLQLVNLRSDPRNNITKPGSEVTNPHTVTNCKKLYFFNCCTVLQNGKCLLRRHILTLCYLILYIAKQVFQIQEKLREI